MVSCLGSNRYFYFIDKRVLYLFCSVGSIDIRSPFIFICDDQKISTCSYYHSTFKITSSNKNANEVTSRTTILTYISLLESSLQNGFHFNFTQQPDLLFHGLLCIPRKRIHNSPLPRLGILGDSIRDYGPRAAMETTFSATGQASAYLKSTAVREQWKIDR